MALIIEDGTGVVGANSYVTVVELKAYAAARGEVFPTIDAEIEALAFNAIDYLEGFRRLFTGSKVASTQSLQYPRLDSTVDGVTFPFNAIPKELKNAQCQLAIDAHAVGSLSPTTTGYAIARVKVDVIETEYAAGGRLSGNSLPAEPQFPKAQAWIDSLIVGSSYGYLRTVRK